MLTGLEFRVKCCGQFCLLFNRLFAIPYKDFQILYVYIIGKDINMAFNPPNDDNGGETDDPYAAFDREFITKFDEVTS